MGDVVRQGRAYTLGVLHQLLGMSEAQWQDQGLAMPQKDISASLFLVASCLGGNAWI